MAYTFAGVCLAAAGMLVGACSAHDEPEKLGSVDSAVAISCGSFYVNQSTSGASQYGSYACAPGMSFDGNEWASTLVVDTTGDVVVSAKDFSWYPWIAVAKDNGGVPDWSTCTANWYSVRFSATAGETWHVILDHDGAYGSVDFDLEVFCGEDGVETDCSDGFDDDNDYLVDCADSDCDADPKCQNGFCTPYGTLSCGDTFVYGETGGFAGTDVVQTYTCFQSVAADAFERAYTFKPTKSEWVNFTMTNADRHPMLFVLEDDGTGCNPNRCVAHNYYSVVFFAEAGKTYYLVADGFAGGSVQTYQYDATLICDPPAVETDCGDTIDNDGDTLMDCVDPDCSGDPACASAQCSSTQTIDCNTKLLAGSTADPGSTDNITNYSCDPGVDLTGWERAYDIGPFSKNTTVLATVSNENAYAAIAVIEDDGGSCGSGGCVALQYYSVKFTAAKGKKYYVVVEPDLADTVSYDLSIVCNPPGIEAGLCNDQIDNDGDFLIDCEDPDCLGTCATCSAAGTLTASTTLLHGNTADPGSTQNAVESYGCVDELAFPGDEYVYTFTAPVAGYYNFTLSNETDYGLIAVVADKSGICDVSNCVAMQYYSTVAYLGADKTYYVIVDGPNPGTLEFDISVVPNPPTTEAGLCGDGIDNDADYLIDCADPDCGC